MEKREKSLSDEIQSVKYSILALSDAKKGEEKNGKANTKK